MSLLLDTGFLYALLNRTEQNHERVLTAIRTIHEPVILPVPAITELAYLLLRDVGSEAVADFIASLAATDLILESPTNRGLPARRRSDSTVRRRTDRFCGCINRSNFGASFDYAYPHARCQALRDVSSVPLRRV